MIEHAPDPPEFNSWEVQGKHESWRVGRRITVVRSGWSLPWKVAALVAAIGIPGWTSFDRLLQIHDRPPGSLEWLLVWTRLLIVSIGAFAVVLWAMGARRITIDWDGKQIVSKRGPLKRRYPLSDLERLELRPGPSSLVETAELVLVLRRTQLRLLETYHEEDSRKRFRVLATVAQRLSDCLHVPLKRPSADDSSELSCLSNLELAEKYIREGTKMELHADSAEMNGRQMAADQYREEAVFLYRSAHDLNPDHSEPLLAMGRLSGDDDLHRRAVEIAAGEEANDVNVLLARARLHHGDGNYELCMETSTEPLSWSPLLER